MPTRYLKLCYYYLSSDIHTTLQIDRDKLILEKLRDKLILVSPPPGWVADILRWVLATQTSFGSEKDTKGNLCWEKGSCAHLFLFTVTSASSTRTRSCGMSSFIQRIWSGLLFNRNAFSHCLPTAESRHPPGGGVRPKKEV